MAFSPCHSGDLSPTRPAHKAARQPTVPSWNGFPNLFRPDVAGLLAALTLTLVGLASGIVLFLQERQRTEAERRRSAETRYEMARQAVDDMYTQVAEKWLAQEPQLENLQREFLEKALNFYQEFTREVSTVTAQRQVVTHWQELAKQFPSDTSYQQELVDPSQRRQWAQRALWGNPLHTLDLTLGVVTNLAEAQKLSQQAAELLRQQSSAPMKKETK